MNDYTVIIEGISCGDTYREVTHRIYYRDSEHPAFLPDAARCEGTIAEWEAWHQTHNTPEWKRYKRG